MFILAQQGTFVQVDFWRCFNNGSIRIDICFPHFFLQQQGPGPTVNVLFGITMYHPKGPTVCNCPGIRVLIQYGRFDAESQGSTDMDEILSAVYASMRDTCSKHGRLGCP